jgi:hypothetical protein
MKNNILLITPLVTTFLGLGIVFYLINYLPVVIVLLISYLTVSLVTMYFILIIDKIL